MKHRYGRVDRMDLGREGKRKCKNNADISRLNEEKDGNSVHRDWELGAESGLRYLWFISSSKQSCQL